MPSDMRTLAQAPEADVREFMRSRGFIDTKVASVSERLTALRFTRRP